MYIMPNSSDSFIIEYICKMVRVFYKLINYLEFEFDNIVVLYGKVLSLLWSLSVCMRISPSLV